MPIMKIIVQALVIVMVAPLLQGFIQWCKARLQNRRGAAPWQPYLTLYKLLSKDLVVARTASWVTTVAPFVCFGAAFAVAGLVPFLTSTAGGFSDLFLIVYLFGLSRFAMALAGLDAGNSFGGMGSSREMYLAILVEPAFLLAILASAGASGSTELVSMVNDAEYHPFTLPYILAAVAFFIVTIAECGRIPVDNPDTHLELTMFQEAMLIEFSGRHLGLLQWSIYIRQLAMVILFVELFFPWNWVSLIPSELLWTIVKIFLAGFLLALAETSTAKMRLFRLPNFLAASGLLSLLALVAR
jgi:formate hydrogenlyase subunit 4